LTFEELHPEAIPPMDGLPTPLAHDLIEFNDREIACARGDKGPAVATTMRVDGSNPDRRRGRPVEVVEDRAELVDTLHKRTQGRKAWPAPLLTTLVLLRWAEDLPREAAIRRASTDLGWRAAMGLPADVKIPSDRTVRDFERFLCERHPDIGVHRYVLLHEHIVRLCAGHGVLDEASIWGVDSTPMWCYGACIDTVRLMGTGLRHLARWWAKATGETFADVARSWQAGFLLAPSTKGGFEIDWKNREQRASVVDTLARAVVRIVADVRQRVGGIRRRLRKRVLQLCRGLAGVVAPSPEPAGHLPELPPARRAYPADR